MAEQGHADQKGHAEQKDGKLQAVGSGLRRIKRCCLDMQKQDWNEAQMELNKEYQELQEGVLHYIGQKDRGECTPSDK